MDKIIELLGQHYEWLFSGLGVTVIGLIGGYIVKIFSNGKEKDHNVDKTVTYKKNKETAICGNNNTNGNHEKSNGKNIDKEQMQAASLLYNDLVSIGNYLAKERSSVNLRYCGEWQKMVAACLLLSENQRKYIYDIYDDVYNYNFFYEQKLKGYESFSKEDIPQYHILKEKIFDRSKGYVDIYNYNLKFEDVLGNLKNIMEGM